MKVIQAEKMSTNKGEKPFKKPLKLEEISNYEKKCTFSMDICLEKMYNYYCIFMGN